MERRDIRRATRAFDHNMETNRAMADNGLTYLLWSDLVGVTRTRGVPTADLDRRMEAGLGWACAGQAMTPFDDIAENPWGPTDEARQIPDPAATFTIPGDADNPAIAAVICNSRAGVDQDWDCCVRTFLARALDDLKAETGHDLVVSFEHEFSIVGDDRPAEIPFSFTAARHRHALLQDIAILATAAGVAVETVEPEYGLNQFEVSCGPEPGLRGADIALIARETIREAVRRHGLRASFSPKLTADATGNGAHVHVSLVDPSGTNVTHDPAGALGLGETARQFSAGVLAHLDALVAFTAPSPVSYYRLGPHHWSCGFRAIGVQNREAALRIIPGVGRDEARRRAGFNIEYRPCDATASPYLALGPENNWSAIEPPSMTAYTRPITKVRSSVLGKEDSSIALY